MAHLLKKHNTVSEPSDIPNQQTLHMWTHLAQVHHHHPKDDEFKTPNKWDKLAVDINDDSSCA